MGIKLAYKVGECHKIGLRLRELVDVSELVQQELQAQRHRNPNCLFLNS